MNPPWTAEQVLDAVGRWAEGCYLLRETGQVGPGRLDGLLVPWTWGAKVGRGGIVAIEAKISRSDFLCGIKKEQCEKYLERVNGLYLATGPDVCKTSEIPKQFGHLVCGYRRGYGDVCVCRRRARWHDREHSAKAIWGIVWDLFDQFRRVQKEAEAERRTIHRQASHVIGDAVAKFVAELKADTTRNTKSRRKPGASWWE